MARFGNLDGTLRDEFSIGPDERIRIKRVGNQIYLCDLTSGEYPLADLIGGGGSSVIETRGILTRNGGLVYTPASGGVALVVRPA